MKKKVLVMLLTVAMEISLLAGCGEGAKTETGADAENAGAEVTAEESEASVVSKVTEEPDEKAEYTKPNSWIESLNLTEPTPFIWNGYTAEGTLITENDTYVLKENEKLIVYSEKEIQKLKVSPIENVLTDGKLKGASCIL